MENSEKEKSLNIPSWIKPAGESFTVLGEFWRPETPDKKLAGTLRYTHNDRTSLELLGDFTGKGVYGQLRGKDSVIMGRLQDGRKCTLLDYDAYVTTHQWEDGEHYKTDVKAIYLFVGKEFDSSEGIVFDQVLLDLSHFNYWMNKPLNIDFGTPPDFNKIFISKDFIGFTANVDLTPCKCISMYPSFRHPFIASHDKGFFVDYKFLMEALLERPISYEELIELHHKITDLFTLLCAEPVYHEVLVGYCEGVPVQVYAASYNRCNPSFDKSGIDVTELPVKQSSFSKEEKLLATFKNWFGFYDDYDDFIKLLVSCLIEKDKTIEEKFLCLARCMEVYSDRKYPSKSRRKDATLENKMLDLLSEIPAQELYPILDNPRDGESAKKEFAEKAANTRNYYTHYNPKLKQKSFSVEELFRANDKLKMIALYLLYRHLGLDNGEFSVLCLKHKIR